MDDKEKIRFIHHIEPSLNDGTFVKMTFGKYRGGDSEFKGLAVTLISTNEGSRLSFTFSYKTKDVVKNYETDKGIDLIREITGKDLRALKALPQDFQPELPSALDMVGWVQTAIDNNPGLKAKEYQLRSAEANVESARAGHYPTLGLQASYGKAIPGLYDPDYIGANKATTNVGLTLSIPIFSGFATQSNVRSALAQRDATADAVEQTRRSIERSTRNAYQGLVAGISEVEARRLALVSAQSAYDASQVGLEVGTRTVLDVLNNQRTLFSAQQDYAQAKYNFLQNRLLLEQAAGTLQVSDLEDVNRLLTTDESVAKAIGAQ